MKSHNPKELLELANGAGYGAPLCCRKLSVDEVYFVRRCVEVVVNLCVLYGFDRDGYSLKSTQDHWLKACSMTNEHPMKFVKWKISAFYSYWRTKYDNAMMTSEEKKVWALHVQETPVPPKGVDMVTLREHPGSLLCGQGYAWIQIFFSKDPVLFNSFITSILRSKTGMPRPGEKLMRESAEKTFVSLTTAPADQPDIEIPLMHRVSPGETVPSHSVDKALIEFELIRTVAELFRGERYTEEDRMKPFFPSTNANYNNSRSGLGAIGAILEDPDLLEGLHCDEKLVDVHSVVHDSGSCYVVDNGKLKRKFAILYQRIVEKAILEQPYAIPVPLSEALKVRVITKGPPMTYTALKPLQKFMWRTLRKNPCFQLIGEPVSARFVSRRMGKLRKGEAFLSADYTAATDNLYSWVSDIIVAAIAMELNLSREEVHLFFKAMTQHILVHPEDKQLCSGQRRGQLMGSIVSFPILCIANAAICRYALEFDSDSFGQILLKDAKLAINGDDAILKVTGRGHYIWKQLAAFIGMSPSVGKVYFSNRFLNINSQTYDYHHDGFICALDTKELIRFEEIQSINLGLMYGLKRSGNFGERADDNETGEHSSLGARAHELIQGAPEQMREKLLQQFISHNSRSLKLVNLPWFIPSALGGLGLPIVGRFTPDKIDLRLARLIHDHPSSFVFPAKPMVNSWLVWHYAMARYKFVEADVVYSSFVTESSDHAASVSDIRGWFCIESLFRLGSNRLYRPQTKSNKKFDHSKAWENLRSWSAVWSGALKQKKIPLPEPYNVQNFPKPDDNVLDWKIIPTHGSRVDNNICFLDKRILTSDLTELNLSDKNEQSAD